MKYKECEYCNCNIYDNESEEYIGLRLEKEYLVFCDEECAEKFILEWLDFEKETLSLGG